MALSHYMNIFLTYGYNWNFCGVKTSTTAPQRHPPPPPPPGGAKGEIFGKLKINFEKKKKKK